MSLLFVFIKNTNYSKSLVLVSKQSYSDKVYAKLNFWIKLYAQEKILKSVENQIDLTKKLSEFSFMCKCYTID